MKKMLKLLVVLIVVSCSGDIEKLSETDLNNDLLITQKTKGILPNGHPVFLALKDSVNYDLDKVDKLYRLSIIEDASSDYILNLKHFGFRLAIEKGLIEKGTNEQKSFYLNEQMKLNRNFANIDSFYNLLLSCKNFMSSKEMLDMADAFYKKNKSAIENSDWNGNTEIQQQKKIELLKNQKLFERIVRLKN